MKRSCIRRYILPAVTCVVIVLGLIYYYFFSSMLKGDATVYFYIDRDDTLDSVFHKVEKDANLHAMMGFRTLMRHGCTSDKLRIGRYSIEKGKSSFTLFRNIKNGQQAPVHLTVPSVRTRERLSAELSKHLMLDSVEIDSALRDEILCKRFGYDTLTIMAMFVPNTYDVYWTVTVQKLLERIKRESNAFWKGAREAKAEVLGLSRVEVMTLASIVDEETAHNPEKPTVAGMYYNRLKLCTAEYPNGMPLQADPTIKYAWKRFDLKRIYHNLLYIDSPYNTYKNVGLPPSPIRIPTVAGIDAVLNLESHEYLYMCANAELNGTHRFSKTYAEHLRYAAQYVKSLNEKGIK